VHTHNGDSNLDGRVNADDYFKSDSGFLPPSVAPKFADGDFNHDGRINADDYFLIDSALLSQGSPAAVIGAAPLSPAASSSAVAAVPSSSAAAPDEMTARLKRRVGVARRERHAYDVGVASRRRGRSVLRGFGSRSALKCMCPPSGH
jgi:hypothetical protein